MLYILEWWELGLHFTAIRSASSLHTFYPSVSWRRILRFSSSLERVLPCACSRALHRPSRRPPPRLHQGRRRAARRAAAPAGRPRGVNPAACAAAFSPCWTGRTSPSGSAARRSPRAHSSVVAGARAPRRRRRRRLQLCSGRRTWTPMCSRLSCTSCTRARCRRGRRRRCPPAPPRKTTTGRRRRRPIDSTSTGWRR